jgi:carboxyl-terminal processing protease
MLGWSAMRVRVVEVPPGGPAAEAGLAPGDVILAIDGTPVAGLSAQQVQAKLRGEVGTPVRLRVLRDAQERELSVPRTPYSKPDRR